MNKEIARNILLGSILICFASLAIAASKTEGRFLESAIGILGILFFLCLIVVAVLFLPKPSEPAQKEEASPPTPLPPMTKNSFKSRKGSSLPGALITLAVLVAVGLFAFWFLVRIDTVQGDEVGVKETWSGVQSEPVLPGTYMNSRWGTQVYNYTTAGQVFVMNDADIKTEKVATGRDADVLEVKSSDNQQVHLSLRVRWRIDPEHVVALHKTYRDSIEEKLLRPEVVRAVSTRATLLPAIDIYSGPKQNQLRQDVENDLRNPTGELRSKGMFVDSFVIEKVTFPNKDYVSAIEARQLAIIQTSQAEEQKKANDALAEAAKALAQSDANKRIVAQQADKEIAILKQQAESEQAIIKAKADAENTIVAQKADAEKIKLAAQAEASRNIAISEAQKQAEINRAVGIEAVGKAEAERTKLLLSSYSVPGSDLYAKIKVSEQFAIGMNQVRFYPSNATFNTIASDFDKGLSLLVGQPSAK